MRELDRALADIGAIRDQIARQDGLRGYGPATVAGTGVLAPGGGGGRPPPAAGAAGAGLALVLALAAPASLWMLPGLWQVALGLGFFAASRSLPRAMALVGGWYVGAGLLTLGLTAPSQALTPWAMGVPFALGQLGAAVLLRRSLEPGDA